MKENDGFFVDMMTSNFFFFDSIEQSASNNQGNYGASYCIVRNDRRYEAWY